MATQGAEQTLNSPNKSQVENYGDAFIDAFSVSRLVKLIEVWPALSDEVRGAIGALVETQRSSDDQNSEIVDRALSGNPPAEMVASVRLLPRFHVDPDRDTL